MQKIEKTGKLNLQPVLFNGVAIAFVLILLPLSVAFISNASTGEIEYESALEAGYYSDGAGSWRMNGGNYTPYYQDLDPNEPPGAFNCGHIIPGIEVNPLPPSSFAYTFGRCVGDESGSSSTAIGDNYVYDNATQTTQINSDKFVFMDQIENAGLYPVADYSNHLGGNTFNNYPIQWGFNSYANDGGALNFDTTDPINSINVIGIDSSDTYACDSPFFGNATITYSIEFIYGNEIKRYTGFTHEYYNAVPNIFLGDCSSYFEMPYVFDNFQLLDLKEFANDDYENLGMILQIDDIEFEDSSGSTVLAPWWGSDGFELYVDYSTSSAEEIRGVVRPATLVLGLIIGYLAIASTAYYDPLRNLFKGAIE
jgi:hypothetical protein